MKVMKTSAIQQNKRKTRKIMDKTTKTITLRRSLSQKGATNGILYMGYRRLCATLERTMRQLPEGNYQLRARRSKNELKELVICPADLPLMAHRPKKPLGTICAGNCPANCCPISDNCCSPKSPPLRTSVSICVLRVNNINNYQSAISNHLSERAGR